MTINNLYKTICENNSAEEVYQLIDYKWVFIDAESGVKAVLAGLNHVGSEEVIEPKRHLTMDYYVGDSAVKAKLSIDEQQHCPICDLPVSQGQSSCISKCQA